MRKSQAASHWKNEAGRTKLANFCSIFGECMRCTLFPGRTKLANFCSIFGECMRCTLFLVCKIFFLFRLKTVWSNKACKHSTPNFKVNFGNRLQWLMLKSLSFVIFVLMCFNLNFRSFPANFCPTKKSAHMSKWTCTGYRPTPSGKNAGPRWYKETDLIQFTTRNLLCSERWDTEHFKMGVAVG